MEDARVSGSVLHMYVSTSCQHRQHTYCKALVATDELGEEFSKRPGECKFCHAPCLCECHGRRQP